MANQSSGVSSVRAHWAMIALLTVSTAVWAQDTGTLLFRAGAYGTYAFVGNRVILGKTATAGVGGGCGTPEEGASSTKTVASVDALPIVATGAINTSATSSDAAATGTADIHQVDLLAGLITGDEVMAVSTTSDNGGSLSSSGAGSNFVKLVVAGTSIQGTPSPNTRIDLAGIGYVILNEQIPSSKHDEAGLTVNMIHVYVTAENALGIPKNTQVVLAHAESGLTVAGGPAVVDGLAFGTKVNVAHVLTSSPTAPVSVGCLGTHGKVLTQSVASVNLSPLATSGTVTDTAEANVTQSLVQSQTSSTVKAANVLSGTMTADVITAAAAASTTDGKTFIFSDTGSGFVELHVAGHPEITDNVPPNTRVDLAGLGTLWLHRVIQKKNSIEVRMIELIVNQRNGFGIAIGTDLRVADASASLHSNTKP
jgi:hypothetical protein